MEKTYHRLPMLSVTFSPLSFSLTQFPRVGFSIQGIVGEIVIVSIFGSPQCSRGFDKEYHLDKALRCVSFAKEKNFAQVKSSKM
jgi:hypothetical protein